MFYIETMKTTFRTNTASKGTMAKFNAFFNLGEFSAVDDSSSFEDSNRISTTAINAPPTPIPMAEVMVIALDAAVVAAVDTITALTTISDDN